LQVKEIKLHVIIIIKIKLAIIIIYFTSFVLNEATLLYKNVWSPFIQSLSGKDDAKLFPNVILILVKATEKRFEGANSNFTKSLMAIK